MENKYTSLELSRKLHKAGVNSESNMFWGNYKNGTRWNVVKSKFNLTDFASQRDDFKYYHAYDILNDICVKYAKEFFGDKDYWDDERSDSEIVPAYIYHTEIILHDLQCGNKDCAEHYIWEHCLFNKKHKR